MVNTEIRLIILFAAEDGEAVYSPKEKKKKTRSWLWLKSWTYYKKVKRESHSVVSNSLRPHELYSPWNSPGQNTGVGSLSLLQGISPTQGSNPYLPHCRWILYELSYQGSPRILEWVAYPFSSGSFRPRNWTQESNWGLLHCKLILYQLSY